MQSIKLIPNITSNFLLGQPHTSLILSLESGQVLFPPSHHSYSKCFLFCLRPESLMILIITYMCQCVLSCLTKSYSLWPYELSPPGSSVQGILRARTLGWVAMTSSRGSSQSRDQTQIPCSSWMQADSLPLSHQGSPTQLPQITWYGESHLVKHWSPALRATQVNSRMETPDLVKSSAWLQPHKEPWARTAQLNDSWISEPQKLWDNVCCIRC